MAKICLTHSFHDQTLKDYIGKFDTTEEELGLIETKLAETVMDDYDKLIQLCDSIAGSEGVVDMEERMEDARRRYGFYPQDKREANFRLKEYFEAEMGRDLYEVVEKESFRP